MVTLSPDLLKIARNRFPRDSTIKEMVEAPSAFARQLMDSRVL